MTATTEWIIFRILRWALWLASIAYFCYYLGDPGSHHTPVGNLRLSTEAFMFALPLAAVFMGFFEVMMRERARQPRPTFSHSREPEIEALEHRVAQLSR